MMTAPSDGPVHPDVERRGPGPHDRSLAGDLWGGLASMLVALPSAIAFGVLVYTAMGPEHAGAGAMAGALGAAALGLVAPLVGRNGGFVTAPCAPAAAVMSGLAATLFVEHGLAPDRVVALMALAALLSAGLQVIYGAVRLGRLIKYIPYQVVTGYLSGVAVIIAFGQLPKLLGLPGDVEVFHGLFQPSLWRWPGIVVGLVTIAVTVAAPRVTQRVPAAILGLLAGIAVYFGLGIFLPDLLVLSGNPLLVGPLDASGSLLGAVADRVSSFREAGLADIGLVLASAATLSVLLSIDTLKTGVVLDALTHSRHDSNRELMAQGVGNAVSALTGGMPGAGTMGPTLVNVTSGGRSPLSGFAEGALVLVAFVALGGLVAWVPIGALAGILLVIAFRMFDWEAFRLLRHRDTRLDFFVIAAVVVVAETVGLIESSVLGVALAILLFIRDQIRGSVILRKRDLREVQSKTRRLAEARDLLRAHGDQGVMVELQDNLFFGTTDQLFSELEEDLRTRRYLLLDMRRVDSMDYTAGHLFHQMQERLQEKGGQLLFSGMPSGMPTGRDIERYLAQLGLVRTAGGIPILETQDSALAWMEDRILEAAGYQMVQDDRALELTEIELFREFDDEALATLASIVQEVHLDAGQALFSQGDGGDQMFLVRRGTIHILLPLPGGKRHHLATLGRGDYFGEMVFLDRGRRSADAEALADTDLYALSRRRFDEVAPSDAVVAAKVFARLALLVSQRLRAADAELRALEDR